MMRGALFGFAGGMLVMLALVVTAVLLRDVQAEAQGAGTWQVQTFLRPNFGDEDRENVRAWLQTLPSGCDIRPTGDGTDGSDGRLIIFYTCP